jgi:hypothetical protein
MGKMVGAGAEIFDKLEPEPKFLTSWSLSRSRTKMTGSATLVLAVQEIKSRFANDYDRGLEAKIRSISEVTNLISNLIFQTDSRHPLKI